MCWSDLRGMRSIPPTKKEKEQMEKSLEECEEKDEEKIEEIKKIKIYNNWVIYEQLSFD